MSARTPAIYDPVPKATDTLGICSDILLAVANDLRSLQNSVGTTQTASSAQLLDEVLQLVNSVIVWHQHSTSSSEQPKVPGSVDRMQSHAT